MPRDPSTGDNTSDSDGIGLNRASSTVSQDPNPAGTGANDAPGTMTTTGTVATTVGQAKVQASGTEPSHYEVHGI